MPRRKIHCWTRMSRFGRRHLHGAGCGTPSPASGAAGHNRRLRSLREKGPRDDDRPGWVVPSTVYRASCRGPPSITCTDWSRGVAVPARPGTGRAQSVPKRSGTTRLWVARRGTNGQVKSVYQSPDQPFGLH